MVRLPDDAFFFHALHDGGGTVVADLKAALDIRRRSFAVAFHNGDGLLIEVAAFGLSHGCGVEYRVAKFIFFVAAGGHFLQIFRRALRLEVPHDLFDFLAAGILAQSALFVAIFYGISAIWERDLGVLQRYLVSPAPRSALVLGKALSAGVRALSQALIVYGLALVLGVGISLDPLRILGVAAAIVLGSALFSTLSLIIACIVKTRERFMGIGQVLTMPIFFASNAIYPLSLMPGWLSAVSHINPLTYEVDALRALMLTNGTTDYGLPLDFAVLLTITAALTAIAARMYRRMGY